MNFTDEQQVLAGTCWGEARGCGRAGMENVAQCILNRKGYGWNGGTIIGVCLAPKQFSSWNTNDPNRAQIIAASDTSTPEVDWTIALDVAEAAIAGSNPDRIDGADSYFAHAMREKPYWAVAPARSVYGDGWHDFWIVRPADYTAYCVSHNSALLH